MRAKQTKEYRKEYYSRKSAIALRKAWKEKNQPRLSLINCTIFLWGW